MNIHLKWVHLFFSSDVVKLLLEYGAFVNQTDKAHYKTGLHVACEAQSVACVQYLLDAGADPNVQAEEGRTPLHIGEYECCHVIVGCKYETFAVMMIYLPSSLCGSLPGLHGQFISVACPRYTM